MSGVLAQSKGRSLGLYEEREKSEAEQRERERRDRQLGVQRLDCFGMKIPASAVRGWWAGWAGGRVSEGSRRAGPHAPQQLSACWASACERSAAQPAPRIVQVGGERHAVSSGQPVDPGSVQSYLQRSFGAQLEAAKVCGHRADSTTHLLGTSLIARLGLQVAAPCL